MKISGTPEEIAQFARAMQGSQAGEGRKWQARPQGQLQAAPAPKREVPEYGTALDLIDAIGIEGLAIDKSASNEDGQVWLVYPRERLGDEDFKRFQDYGKKNALKFDPKGKLWVFKRTPEPAPNLDAKGASQ